MSYVVFYMENGTTTDISDYVTGIQFSGDRLSAARKLDIALVGNTGAGTGIGTGTSKYGINLKRGSLLILVSGSRELIRGVIFKEDRDEKGGVRVTAYTHGIYLTKNRDTKKFEQQKASQIAQTICRQYGIPAGEIADTKIVLPKLLLREKTLWDILVTALTETTKHNGIKYRVFFREGKLNIAEKRSQTAAWVLESDVNLLSASKSSSIEELKNQIKVTAALSRGKSREIECVVKDDSLQKLYGVLQEVRGETGDGMTESKIKQMADTALKELGRETVEVDVDALGNDDIEAGMAVYVYEPVTKISGLFYVEQDDHSIEGGKHTMKLKLSLSDEIPELQYEKP